MELKRFSLCIAFGGPTDSSMEFMGFLQEICEVFQLQIVGFIPVSASGAWPEITFRGTKENLTRFSMEFHAGDQQLGQDMINDYMTDDAEDDFYVFVDDRYSSKGDRKFIEESGEFKEL